MLLAQSLQRLVLGDLHTRAHVAVTVYKEGEGAGQVLAAGTCRGGEKETLKYLNSRLTSLIKKNHTQAWLCSEPSGMTQDEEAGLRRVEMM